MFFFFFTDPAPPEIYTLSLHDALPIWTAMYAAFALGAPIGTTLYGAYGFTAIALATTLVPLAARSEEHTSELQSRRDLVCRLLLEKKKKKRCTNENKLCYRSAKIHL